MAQIAQFSPMAKLLGALVLAGFAICLVLNLPGHLSYDSLAQLLEGRTAVYGNWHPPVMSWLLGIADWIHPGPALFVVFDGLLLYGSLMSILWLKPRAHWAAAPVLLVVLATPQFVLYPGLVWKDVLFAGATLAGFVALSLAAKFWPDLRSRAGLLAASAVLLVLAVLTRQNGAVLVPFAALAVGLVARAHAARRPLATALAWGAAAFALLIVVSSLSYAALLLRSNGNSSPLTQIGLLQTYDLAGAVANDPKLPLARLHNDDPALERAMRRDAARLYTPERNDTLASSAALQSALNNADPATIPAQWWNLVGDHTLLYLKVRWDAFRWVFFTPNATACRPAYAGISGFPAAMNELGLAPRFDARDRTLVAYTSAFEGSPLLSHAFYAAAGIVLVIVLLRRRGPADLVFGCLLLAAFAFTMSFFAISIACDYRYLYVLDVAAMSALLYVVMDAPLLLLWSR